LKKGSVYHDTHATPPLFIQKEHWRYQGMRKAELERDPNIFDLSTRSTFTKEQADIWRPAGSIPASRIANACQAYAGGKILARSPEDAPIFEHRDFPGLQVVSGLLPPETQIIFTSCLMHRDLADPGHKINLQADFKIAYPPKPTSEALRFDNTFFKRERAATEDCLIPNTPEKQKPLNNEQFLYNKLRWLTLGEQYDWPTRSYSKHTTPFPADLSTLVNGLFPHIRPESGVVLMYSAKDFMPVHRVSAETPRP
jgi:alkylated DNA repair protein alkB family protein 1